MFYRRFHLAIVSAILGCPAEGAIFDRDDRISNIESGMPVGLVERGLMTYGTGFLIDECHALTAKHVVGHGKATGKRIRFRLEPWRDSADDNSSAGTVILAGEGEAGSDGYVQDWALIELDRCLGKKAGYYPISDQAFYLQGGSARLQPTLIAMGYPSDRGRRRLTIDPTCAAWQRTTVGLKHDCATSPGGSGGPILAWNAATSQLEAVGVNVASFRQRSAIAFSLDRANLAVELAPVRTEIQSAIAQRAMRPGSSK